MADQKTDAEKAQKAAHDAEVKATEARAKAEIDPRTPQERKADSAEAKADDARAKAAEAAASADPAEPMTAGEAKALLPNHLLDLPAGAHLAQKFGNDPANPQLAPGLDPDEGATVRLSRITPDSQDGPVVTMVHPEMVGDYLRAGWSKD